MPLLDDLDQGPSWRDRLLPGRLIVTFHGIGMPVRSVDQAEEPYWVEPAALQEAAALARGAEIDITFDDGNDSDLHLACPILLEAGLVGRFFVLAGRLDQPGSLRRTDVRELAGAGMSIGSHGFDHINWTKASDTDLRRELVDARIAIEDCLGAKVDTVSVPFGAFDRRVLKMIAQAGYRRVHTSSETLAYRAGWLMPRYTIQRGTDIPASLSRWTSLRSRAESAVRNVLRGYRYGFSTSTAGPCR